MKTIVLGISSGIAEFKVIELINALRQDKIDVHVIMTKNSAKMMHPSNFEKASGNKVHSELFGKSFDYKKVLKERKVEHIDIADKADLFVVIPATANIIGKIANGIADDFLTTSVMAAKAPIVICPAMNSNMWSNPIVKENIEKLRNLGYIFFGPDYGMLACGYKGPGRLIETDKVRQELLRLLRKRDDLKGKKVIVTAGATIEDIDPVRHITNKSSGKMGIALAEEAWLRGADVLLLRGKNSASPRYPVKEIVFTSSADLREKLRGNIKYSDMLVHSAAVSDFRVEKAGKKIKSDKKLKLELSPAAKILEKVKGWNKGIFLVGFKAELENLEESARKILKSSEADMIIANDVGRDVFGSDTNEVLVVDSESTKKIPRDSKINIAGKIIDEVVKRI